MEHERLSRLCFMSLMGPFPCSGLIIRLNIKVNNIINNFRDLCPGVVFFKFVLKCMKKSQTWAKYISCHFYNPITTRQVQIVVQLIANYHLAVDFQSSSLGVKPGKKNISKVVLEFSHNDQFCQTLSSLS